MILSENIISVVHFMAFPGRQNTDSMLRGEPDERYLMNSLKIIADDPYFKGIEVTRIKDPALRKKAIDFLSKTGMTIFFGAQPVQLLNEEKYDPADISSINELERKNAVDRLKRALEEAYQFGAVSFAFISGKDQGPDVRETAKLALIRSIVELAEYSRSLAKEFKREPIRLVLEMFDRINDPRGRFANQLIGPTFEAIEVARRIRDEYEIPEFGLLYDLSHMYLLRNYYIRKKKVDIKIGEDENVQEIKNVVVEEEIEEPEAPVVLQYLMPYLVHVHIGNCVLDPNDPRYGDSHASFAYPGGAMKVRDVANFVKALHEMGYKGPIGFEIRPYDREGSVPVLQHAKAFFDDARTWQDVIYGIGGFKFATREYFPEWAFYRLTDIRINHPEIAIEELKNRKKRKKLTDDGYLVLLAADHPARRVTSVVDDPIAMGDRLEYLGRVVRVLASGFVDGVMATPDIIEELAIINHLFKKAGKKGFLDGKLVIGSMNRSGLSGTYYEMEDDLTSYTPEDIKKMNLDGGKLLFRLDTGRYSRFSIRTMRYCAEAMRRMNDYGLPVFLEPLPVTREREDQPYRVIMDPEEIIKMVNIASAMGGSTLRTWIKIPYLPSFDKIARSTTLPILILGGEATGDPTITIENVSKALGSAPNVRGTLVGRNILWPGRDDPRAIIRAIWEVVHNGLGAADALEVMLEERGKNLNELVEIFEKTLL